jgi:hypothetical protein
LRLFLSRCTMSSALPWSAVTSHVPPISSTAVSSFCAKAHACAQEHFTDCIQQRLDWSLWSAPGPLCAAS